MSLNFQNAGDYAKAVYGDANSQHVGSNGAIAMNNVSSVGMKGGRRNKNQSKKNQRGGNNKSKKNQSKKNQSKKNQSKKNQQKGGK